MSDSFDLKPHQAQSPLHRLLQGLVNFALQADAQSKRALADFDGKRIRIDCSMPAEDLTLTFQGGELFVQPADPLDPPANALIRGTAPALLRLLVTGTPNSAVTLDGDLGLIAALTALAKGYNPDLLGLLRRGQDAAEDVVTDTYRTNASQFRAVAEEALSVFTSAMASTGRQAKSELHERFTNSAALDEFLAKLHDARLAVDRLDAKVSLAEQKRSN